MKKICIITTISGTLEAFVLETAKLLHKEEGYEITLICDNNPDFAKSLPEYLRYIPVKMARGIDFSALRSIISFYKIFKAEKFDLVQYSTPNASCYASIAAFLARVPIRLYCQWGIRYVGIMGKTRKIFKAIEKMVCKLSTHIRAVSHLNMQFAIDEKLYKKEKVAVIGNGGTIGVDTKVYDIENKPLWKSEIRARHNIGEKDFVFGFAGRISADKGCRELLMAFKGVVENHPNAKLLVVGPTESTNGIDEELLSFAQQSEAVIFTDRVDRTLMKNHYSAMDVLIHPTYREGFGMVIQEAGALKVPVITTKIPGASEVMEDGVSCLLVSPKSADELENAMEYLIQNPDKAIALGEQAYTRTKALYDRPIMLSFQRKEYKKILGEA